MNQLSSSNTLSKDDKKLIVKIISPFCPHLSEELWEGFGYSTSIFNDSWPSYDENKIIDNAMTIAVQVNGKLRGSVDVPVEMDKESILAIAKDVDNVKKFIEGMHLIKEIYVPNKLVNLVVK